MLKASSRESLAFIVTPDIEASWKVEKISMKLTKVVTGKLMVDCLYYQKEPAKDTSTKIPGKISFWRGSITWDTFDYRRGAAQC